MYGINPSDMASDNLDAANADWEDYAAYLDSTHDDAEEFERDQLAEDYAYDVTDWEAFGSDEGDVLTDEDWADLDAEYPEYDDPLSYDDQWGAGEYGF